MITINTGTVQHTWRREGISYGLNQKGHPKAWLKLSFQMIGFGEMIGSWKLWFH